MHIALIAIGALLTLDTFLLSMVSNGHLGTYLPAIMGIPMLIIGIFKNHFFPWFQTPLGRWIKTILIIIYAAAVVFVCIMGALLSSSASKRRTKNRVMMTIQNKGRNEKCSPCLQYTLHKTSVNRSIFIHINIFFSCFFDNSFLILHCS